MKSKSVGTNIDTSVTSRIRVQQREIVAQIFAFFLSIRVPRRAYVTLIKTTNVRDYQYTM